MSEYHTVQVVFKDEEVLTQSLKDMGYQYEVHPEGIRIGENSYSGRKIEEKSHIVVRKNQFGGFGDVGFERTNKGFVMHADDYDVGRHGDRFKLKKLNKTYVENKLNGYVRNTSRCNIFSRTENEKGQIEIQLRLM
jgi:hypothetical protein